MKTILAGAMLSGNIIAEASDTYKLIRREQEKLCKHATTVKLSSIQKQICADCNARLDWPLKDGQQPLVSSSRDKRRKQ